MADEVKSLDDLKDVVDTAELAEAPTAAEAVSAAITREPVRDELGRSYATGKRKDAIARVWIKPGSGKVIVNGKEQNTYFARPVLQMILRQPFTVSGTEDQFDVMATVKGGGLSGQAGAVKHGISKALQLYDPSLRGALKAAGFLTRDSRVVERGSDQTLCKIGHARLRHGNAQLVAQHVPKLVQPRFAACGNGELQDTPEERKISAVFQRLQHVLPGP